MSDQIACSNVCKSSSNKAFNLLVYDNQQIKRTTFEEIAIWYAWGQTDRNKKQTMFPPLRGSHIYIYIKNQTH